MEKRTSLSRALLGTALPVVLWTMPLHAQTAEEAKLPKTNGVQTSPDLSNKDLGSTRAGRIEEVTVTAARKAQSIQKTSIAVTAFSGTDIRQQGLTNLQEIIRDVPGVTITTQQRGFTPTIRGQGTDLPPGSGQGAVATEFDGVYNIRAEAGLVGYYDLSRVEVLPGPQGTLYGVNSDGGVVNVISNDPQLGHFGGNGSFEYGNYRKLRGELAVNVPIGDSVAVRIAGAAINREGYLDEGNEDAVAQALRAKILYKPNADLSMLAGVEYIHIGGVGSAGSVPAYQEGSINDRPNPWMQVPTTMGPDAGNSQEHYNTEKYWFNASYNMGPAVVSILPAYTIDHDSDYLCGAAGPPGFVGPGACAANHDPLVLEQFSGELRVTNAPGSKLQWDVGYYHWNYRSATAGQGPVGYVGTSSNAGFAEFTYPVLPSLRVIGGIRQSYDDRFTRTGGNLSAQFSHFDYRAGLEYDVAPKSMLYFTVSSGYRPGGFNNDPVTGAPTLYKTEEITSFELGSKNRFFDDTVLVNADAFYYLQKNYQLLDFYFPDVPACQGPPGAILPPFCNPPTLNLKAHIYGVEAQTRWNITPVDQLAASFSVLETKFDNQGGPCLLPSTGSPQDGCYAGGNDPITNAVFFTKIDGSVEPHAPKFSGNFDYRHSFLMPWGATVDASASVFVSTKYFVHPSEQSYSQQPSYWTQNAGLAYTPASGSWRVNAYMRNISNYAVKNAYVPANIGEPRTYGLVLSDSF